ncbi:uncharacterized protein A4U43_C08F8680 [Asparagus officinalis]|nr:uncharacterized protein A4U43_C08F8680 [Asparagus officinalis]
MATHDNECEGKQCWLELLGYNANEAVAIIQAQNHRVEAIVVHVGDSIVQDFRCTRVWVWANDDNVVVEVPKVG